MNNLTVNDINALVHLIDVEQNRQEAMGIGRSPRLSYIRVLLVDQAIEVNGGVDV